MVELVEKYKDEITQNDLKFLDGMLIDLKDQFEKKFKTSSEMWSLSATNKKKLKNATIEIIGSDGNIQRIKESMKNLDLDKVFNLIQSGSKEETKKTLDLEVKRTEEVKTKLNF